MAVTIFKPIRSDDLLPIYNGDGELVKVVSKVEVWLSEHSITYCCEPATEIQNADIGLHVSQIVTLNVQIGSNYTFERADDAVLFKLRWI